MNFVTSFRSDAPYWKRFIKSYLLHVPHPLTVFYEGENIGDLGPQVTCRDLMQDEDLIAFLEDWGDIDTAHGLVTGTGRKDYRWDAIKFCKKVFAVTNPDRPPGPWVWCDADVEFYADFKHPQATPKGKIAYLGRKDWHHSECGWVAYDQADDFLLAFRSMYTDGYVFELKEWHDSYVFDSVRKTFSPTRFVDLSPEAIGMDVWEQSVLDQFAQHHKGPLAKARVYR